MDSHTIEASREVHGILRSAIVCELKKLYTRDGTQRYAVIIYDRTVDKILGSSIVCKLVTMRLNDSSVLTQVFARDRLKLFCLIRNIYEESS